MVGRQWFPHMEALLIPVAGEKALDPYSDLMFEDGPFHCVSADI